MKAQISLRTRIVLVVVSAIIPLFGMSIFKAMHNADEVVARAKSNLEFAALLAAASQERLAASTRQALTVIASLPGVQDGKDRDCGRYLTNLPQRLPEYLNLGLVGLNGHTRCHALGDNSVFVGDRDYFRDAISQRRLVVSTYTVGRVSGKPAIVFALPVIDAKDQVSGVVFASFDLAEMPKLIAGVPVPPGATLEIQDREGTLLAGRPALPKSVGQKVRSPVVLEAVKNPSTGVREGLDGKGADRLWAFLPGSPNAESAVFVSVSRDQVVGSVRRQLWLELAVLMLVAFLGGWISWMIAGSGIVAPTRQILHAAQELEQGHLDVRIPFPREDFPGEFSRIAASFNLMAESLEYREKALEMELVRSQQAYSTLEATINSMQEGLMAVDSAGKLLLINETASRLFATDAVSRVLAPQWSERQGFYIPGSETLYPLEELPLNRALRGESGGPMPILMRNEREPEGRLISCSYRSMQGPEGVVGALMVFADITQVDQLQLDQTRSYEQLRETQRKLLNAQRLGRIGNWELDLKTLKLWWSDEVYELFGVPREDFDGDLGKVTNLIHPEDRAAYVLLCDAAIRDGQRLDIDYRILTPKGDIRWIHQLGEVHADADGTPILRAGVVQDITERKLADQAAARNTAMLRRTGDMGKIGGWEIILDGMQVVWSEQVYRIHEADVGTPVSFAETLAFYLPEAQPTVSAAVQAAAEHGTPWDLELPMVTAAGRQIWVKEQGRALWQDGKIVRVVGALQDITEKHESQEQLRLLETSIARLNDIVLITEADPLQEPGPRIVFVNDAFERRTGYTREEVLGKSPRFLQGPKTQRAELDRIGAALQNMEPVRAELINYKKNGEELWLDLDIVPLANAEGRFTHMVAVQRDITWRKLAEQALIDGERRYAALFQSAPLPMWVVDTETQGFMAVNEACIQRYGYTQEEFMDMTIFDIRSELEGQRLREEIASGLREDVNRRLHRRKDGSEFHVETVSRLVHYDGRHARFVVGLDMSSQVKAEKDVQDYLFTLQRAADATQAITLHQALEATMQETVDQARAVVGAHQAVVSLKGHGELFRASNAVSHSDKYANSRDFVRHSHDCGLYSTVCDTNSPHRLTQEELEALPQWDDAERMRQPGKPPLMRGWLGVPLTGRDGKNIGLLQMTDKYAGEFTLQDQYVSVELAQLASIAIENATLFEQVHQLNLGLEEKVVERTAALARQEALFRALAEQAPQVVWNADPDGKLTYVNRKWYEMMGGKPSDWMGNKWLTIVHPDDLDGLTANWESSRQTLEPYEGMRRLLAGDGIYHTMSYRATPVLDEEGAVLFWVGIDADVTEIKAIESALRLSNQELEAFSYSVSHDLRSPLNTVDGFSRLLAKQLTTDCASEKIPHYLSRIQAGVAQMGRLIEDLLSLAQVARMQLRNETVDLSALAREIVEECKGRNPERVANITIENGLQVQGDSRLLRVVMENLVGNAWKFTSQRACAEIWVGYKADPNGVSAFYVQDNGAGFDMAYADKLFNTFQRLHAVTEFPGTGVGLATVSRVIGRHRGKVWALSELGKGATFFFTLPGTLAI